MRRRAVGLVLLAGANAVLAAVGSEGAAAPCPFAFTEIAAGAGIAFDHDAGARGEKHLPETMGAGVAWVDFDGDGWLDIYLVQSGPFPPPPGGSAAAANRLFRNLGGDAFAEVPGAAGAADTGYGQGVVAADIDGDGDADLLVANFGQDRLFLNRGDGTFTAAPWPAPPGWTSSFALADGDGDGDLDAYAVRYLEYDPAAAIWCGEPEERRTCDPTLFAGAHDLYLVQEAPGVFRDATAAVGLAGADGKGLGVLFADLDGDGDADLYVANDLTPNLLFANRGDGTFADLSLLSGAAANAEGGLEAGMGLALGDVDGDGRPELAVTNFDVETNTLYRNLGELQFEDVSAASGFGLPSFNRLGFGILLADLEGDGDLDAWVANGHIFERPRRDQVTHAQEDLLLAGDGGGRFAVADCDWIAGTRQVGRGLAAADFDLDGDPGVAASVNDGRFQLWRNETTPAWLGLRLAPPPLGGGAVGAVVTLRTAGGSQRRWVTAGDSYQSSSDPSPLFGLGEAAPEALEVRWPDGRRERFLRPPAGRWLVRPAERDAAR